MTVEELIRELKKQPQTRQVICTPSQLELETWGLCRITQVRLSEDPGVPRHKQEVILS